MSVSQLHFTVSYCTMTCIPPEWHGTGSPCFMQITRTARQSGTQAFNRVIRALLIPLRHEVSPAHACRIRITSPDYRSATDLQPFPGLCCLGMRDHPPHFVLRPSFTALRGGERGSPVKTLKHRVGMSVTLFSPPLMAHTPFDSSSVSSYGNMVKL